MCIVEEAICDSLMAVPMWGEIHYPRGDAEGGSYGQPYIIYYMYVFWLLGVGTDQGHLEFLLPDGSRIQIQIYLGQQMAARIMFIRNAYPQHDHLTLNFSRSYSLNLII